MNKTQIKIIIGFAAISIPIALYRHWGILIAALIIMGYMIFELREGE